MPDGRRRRGAPREAPRSGSSGRRLVGVERPRLFTPPLRRLTRATSAGYAVADFADLVLGEPLLPWQRWLAVHALELTPEGLFRFRTVLGMCGRQNGKTSLLRTITLWRMYVDGAQLVLGAAQDLSTAVAVWRAVVAAARGVPELSCEIERVAGRTGDERFVLTSGAEYQVSTSNRRAGRGRSADLLVLDELREQRDWSAWSALSKTTMARPDGQIWGITSAGDGESVVLNHLREAALAGRDPSIGLFEWSAPDGCELDDPKAWAAANPGLGYTISEQAIRSALGTDPPAVFRNEVLCQRVETMDGAVDLSAWRACSDPAGSMDGLRDRVVVGVDVAPDGAHVSVVAAAVTADGRVRLEPVEAWSSTASARGELGPLLARIGPTATAWFPGGPAAALAPELRSAPGSTEVRGGQVGEACQAFADLVAARRVVHPGDPLLDAHVAGAKRHEVGDGWRFVRRGAGHVDAVYAAAGAAHVARALAAKPSASSAYEERGLVTL